MISLVSRLIYNYNSKPPLTWRDYLPLCISEWGESLSWLQESLSWKPDFFFHTFSEQTVPSEALNLMLSLISSWVRGACWPKLTRISFLLKQMTRDSWGASRSERNTCFSCKRECVNLSQCFPIPADWITQGPFKITFCQGPTWDEWN